MPHQIEPKAEPGAEPKQESKRAKKSTLSNKDLAKVFQVSLTTIWRPKYITSIYVFAGSHTDPWATKDPALLKAAKICLDKLYPNHSEEVVMEGAVFAIVSSITCDVYVPNLLMTMVTRLISALWSGAAVSDPPH